MVWNERKVEPKLGRGHGHSRSRLDVIILEHVWDQLFTVDTIWNIGETGDINTHGWMVTINGIQT